MYPVYGAEVDGKVVALQLVFIDQSAEDEEPEDNDCMECGAELESDGSCNYCEFLQSKQED
jgi:tRNA(Ile2) C34 agmatinyltransferase TiaS